MSEQTEYGVVELSREFLRRWIIVFRPGTFRATHRQAYPPVNFEDVSPEGLAGQLRDWEKEHTPEGETIGR